ncbi:hemolysin family protein [Corynebacterium lubricantis]|uniref:hemolysin family protein n=1 Tax=Corynebacterium lubricantis TaxID=541095 RepID=UPI00037144B1|nr:hemolysin family protein [Corynebacterium lubricantis]
MSILVNFLLVLLFVLIGGVFAATEMALVSLRESQIKKLERGKGAAKTVAGLARDSGLFLSAVQIGVTFAGFFSSAFGASTIAPQLAPYLVEWGMSESWASGTALVVMTLIVSYLSLVLGELVPKRIAMQKAESVALVVAPPLNLFAKLMRPVIWIVNTSSNGLLRLLGFDPNARTEEMSTEEVRDIVSSHDGLAESERAMLDDVFEAGERLVGEVMRHRSDMATLPATMTVGEAAQEISDKPYSRYPVYGEDIDDIVGFVHVRDVLEYSARGDNSEVLTSLKRSIVQFPSTVRLPQALSQMRASGHHIAIVVDEYGGTDGMVTLEDLIEELVGEIWDEYDREEHAAVMKLHDSKLLDGSTNLEDFHDLTTIELPEGPYETVAGWMLTKLGRLGQVGDTVTIDPELSDDTDDDSPGVRYQLEIAKVSGNRIVSLKVLKTTTTESDQESAEESA